MVAEGIEVTLALEAAGEAAQGRGTLEDGDSQASLSQGVGRRATGKPPAQHYDRWVHPQSLTEFARMLSSFAKLDGYGRTETNALV
jgi:hypothetical protein